MEQVEKVFRCLDCGHVAETSHTGLCPRCGGYLRAAVRCPVDGYVYLLGESCPVCELAAAGWECVPPGEAVIGAEDIGQAVADGYPDSLALALYYAERRRTEKTMSAADVEAAQSALYGNGERDA